MAGVRYFHLEDLDRIVKLDVALAFGNEDDGT